MCTKVTCEIALGKNAKSRSTLAQDFVRREDASIEVPARSLLNVPLDTPEHLVGILADEYIGHILLEMSLLLRTESSRRRNELKWLPSFKLRPFRLEPQTCFAGSCSLQVVFDLLEV